MRRRWYVYLLTLFSALMLLVAVWRVVEAERILPDLSPPASPPRSAFGNSIAATGLVEPKSQNIAVGSALSGVVVELHVPPDQVGQTVKRGDPLFRVDDRRLHAELDAKLALVKAAEVQLQRLEAMPRRESLPPGEAKVRSARATAERTLDDFKRAEQLHRKGTVSEQELVTKRLSYQAAEQEVAVVEAEDALLKAGAWKADKVVATAQIAAARADAELARAELARAEVLSPIDGRVLHVNVRLGEYVTAGSKEPLIVVGDVAQLHVRVDVDEADIPRFQASSAAFGHVRGAADAKVPLEFVRIEPLVTTKKSLTGENTERLDTRVLQVIYAARPSGPELHVGQQMDVFIQCQPKTTSANK